MTWWDLRRILRDIERASDRWRLVEATRRPGADQWRVIVDNSDTGLWHTLDGYTDPTAARPTLPIGLVSPAPRAVTPAGRPDGRARRDGGRHPWGELLAARAAELAAGADPVAPRGVPGSARGSGPTTRLTTRRYHVSYGDACA